MTTSAGPDFDIYIWSGDPYDRVKASVDGFISHDIPISAFFGEGDPSTGSDNLRCINYVTSHGIKMLQWHNSDMCIDCPNGGAVNWNIYNARTLLPGVADKDLPVVRDGSGNPLSIDLGWAQIPGYIDFTHPRALDLVVALFKYELDRGVSGSMVDFADDCPANAVLYDGRKGDEMRNFYAYDYQRTFAKAYSQRLPGNHVLFARGACAGTQAWVCNFAGDQPSSFRGIQNVVTGILNLSSCGFSNWGNDMGQYGVTAADGPNTAADVYMRSYEFGTFSPIMRLHGRQPREPWVISDGTTPLAKRLTWLRENLLDHIYSEAIRTHKTGISLVQAMPVAFPGVADLQSVGNQYLFANDILVAPVWESVPSRFVNFPPGNWVNIWTGETVSGPVTKTISAPLGQIPAFFGAGACMPMRIAPSLTLGESFSADTVLATMVTAPTANRSIEFWSDSLTSKTFTLSPGNAEFSLSASSKVLAPVVILYGTSASGVTVDGESLVQLSTLPVLAQTKGFFPESNRTVVRVPQGWTTIKFGSLGQTITTYRIKNRSLNMYLYNSGDSVGYNATPNGLNYEWLLEDARHQTKELRNYATNGYMNSEHQKGYVECGSRDTVWASSKWFIEDAGGGFVRFKNSWRQDQFIHVENKPGIAQYGTIQTDWWSAMWSLEPQTHLVSQKVPVALSQKPGPLAPGARLTLFGNKLRVANAAIGATIAVYNAQGKTVMNRPVVGQENFSLNLARGIYFCKLTNANAGMLCLQKIIIR